MVRRSRSGSAEQRIAWLTAIFVVAALVLAGRTVVLPFLPLVAAVRAAGHEPIRGSIAIGSHSKIGSTVPLAANASRWLVAANPRKIEDPASVATLLAATLTLDGADLTRRLSNRRTVHAVIAHALDDAAKSRVAALSLPGITLEAEAIRQYPLGTEAAHVTGFLGFDGDRRLGQYGLEAYYDSTLRGIPGASIASVVDGADLLTTLDRDLQDFACSRLADAVQKHGASGGSVVIVDPKTGAILALCGAPTFDPNRYTDVTDVSVFLNPAVTLGYEPGSVFKTFTLGGAIEAGAITPDTTYTDTGSVSIGKFTIKNSDGKAHGVQTMRQVLEESLNTGAIFAARTEGAERFDKTVHDFGFGAKTGIDLPAEATGNLGKLDSGKDIYVATASYGQGITVTTLQLAMAYAAVANKGTLMEPYLVARTQYPDGKMVEAQPHAVRSVLSPATAIQLSAMLVGVVERGHGKRAGVPGYYIAGKTGTAQIPNRDTAGYEPGATIGTFAGFGPVENPRFTMVVRIDRPQDVQFAESSAAPLFGEIAAYILRTYGIAPNRPLAVP